MQQYVTCTECGGTGRKPSKLWRSWTKECPACNGRGKVLKAPIKAQPKAPCTAPSIGQKEDRVIPSVPANDGSGDIAVGLRHIVEVLGSRK